MQSGKIIAGKCTSRLPIIENPSAWDQALWSAELTRRDDEEIYREFSIRVNYAAYATA